MSSAVGDFFSKTVAQNLSDATIFISWKSPAFGGGGGSSPLLSAPAAAVVGPWRVGGVQAGLAPAPGA